MKPENANEHAAGDLQEIIILNQELEHVRAEFERYMEAAHKAGVVFSVGSDGVVRAEYNPELAKRVSSWDADGEIEQPGADLKAALEALLLGVLENSSAADRRYLAPAIDKARAALAKARGEQHA